MRPTVTYVSAYIDLAETRPDCRAFDICFENFKKLVDSQICICLFVSFKYHNILSSYFKNFNNVYIMSPIELCNLEIYNITSSIKDLKLPECRQLDKDTFNFLTLINAKIEFVQKAIEKNPFNTSHFSWIDFNICNIVKYPKTLKRLHTYGYSQLKDKMLLTPVSWDTNKINEHMKYICRYVCWRFLAGFFIGDKESLLNFYECNKKHLIDFLQQEKTLIWEANYWAWLEYNKYLHFDTFESFTHNDEMLIIPSKYLKVVASLTTIPSRIERCKKAILSLIHQVDQVYLSVSSFYERFGNFTIPDFSQEPEFLNKLIIINSKDYGPATKYLGALNFIPENCWIFFCDDDQQYRPDLISKMTESILLVGAYQNHYDTVKTGSGGIIHGYVGNLFHKELLRQLPKFILPDCAKFIDDQWMSVYCFFSKIDIYPTSAEHYSEIFSVLCNGCEQIGEDALIYAVNRSEKVKELEAFFKIKFKLELRIEHDNSTN
jgi:hypothetical protein